MKRHLALRLARGRLPVVAAGLLWTATLQAQGTRAERSAAARHAAAAERSPGDSACFDQHERGQELRQESQLLASRAAFLACAASECPGAVQHDCQRWSSEVAAQLPSVVFRVSQDGNVRADASLSIDGTPQPDALAAPVMLDPGLHHYRVQLAAASPLEGEVELQAGAPVREVALDLHALEPKRPIPTLSWVLGGVGLASAASFIGFGLASRSLEHELEGRCSPLCSDEQIERVRQRSLFANISLGVSLTSLATAGAWYFLSRPEQPGVPAQTTLEVGLLPVDGGLLGNLQLRGF